MNYCPINSVMKLQNIPEMAAFDMTELVVLNALCSLFVSHISVVHQGETTVILMYCSVLPTPLLHSEGQHKDGWVDNVILHTLKQFFSNACTRTITRWYKILCVMGTRLQLERFPPPNGLERGTDRAEDQRLTY